MVWFITSILSNFIIIYYFRKKDYALLLLFPLFAFSGRWLITLTQIPNSVYFCYFELILSFIVFRKYKGRNKNSKLLIMLPLVSLPSLIYIHGFEGISTYFFYFFLLSSAVGYYYLFIENMHYILNENYFEKIVLLWTFLGFIYKLLSAIEVQTWFLLSRAGSSLWASNHQAMIILLFLPFVKRKWITFLSIAFICLHFSRGVYFALILYLILYFIFISRIRAIKILRYASISILLSISFLMYFLPRVYDFGVDALYARIVKGGTEVTAPSISNNYIWSISDIYEGIYRDDRNNIYNNATEIAYRTNYLGIGLGRFADGLKMIGSPMQYSNAHNIYYTLLSEGGIFFLLVFLFLIFFILKKSFKYDKRIFVSILIFMFYGFFSGQIYESTAERSCTDYFYLIFLLAYLEYQEALKLELIKES